MIRSDSNGLTTSQDDLEPGLKVQTERRLASLLADLDKAEQRDVQKKMGARYHMVRPRSLLALRLVPDVTSRAA